MKVFKFKRRIEIDKTIGNIHINTFHHGSYENDKHKHWTELHCWYEPDCEHCCMGWKDSSYEGECNDCGCCFNYEFDVPIWKCMLPYWVKRLIKKIKGW